VVMSPLDGWAVLKALKADPNLAHVPVVMITIVDNPVEGFALGAADYLTKPIDWRRLGTTLNKYRKDPMAAAEAALGFRPGSGAA
jgi:DNA-binding response OmpR family regulator